MDFVNEQHVAFFEIGEQAGEVAGFLNRRAAGSLDVCAHRLGENVGDGGFAEAGRAGQQDVVERLAALLGGGHGNLQALLHLGLAGEIGKERGPQRHFQRGIGFVQVGNRTFGHGNQLAESARQRQEAIAG